MVGGGHVALRKVRMLQNSGADVTTISPTLQPGLVRLVKNKTIHLIQRTYKPGDLKGAVIVIAATDEKQINLRVAKEAQKMGALVNVVDDPEPSSFILPSYFRKGNLTLAVSTGGVSPALARKIRTRLEKEFGKEYATLLSLIGEVRSLLKEKGLRVDAKIWQEALDLDLLIQLVHSGKLKEAKLILLDKLIG